MKNCGHPRAGQIAFIHEDNRTVTTINQTSPASEVIEKTSQAHMDGVRTLYKFMSYPIDGTAPKDNAERRRRAEALLRHGELYFATAQELNDPFEASPHFRFPNTTPDELTKEVLSGFRNTFAPKLGLNEEQILAREKTLTDEIHSGTFVVQMKGNAQQYREMFRSEYPMCCLTTSQENTLMWSYYSGGHTGICVHFDATKPPIFFAERVIYSEQYPALPLLIDEVTPDELRTLTLLTKSRAWKHEHEYRLINWKMTFPPAAPKRILDDQLTWKSPQLAVIPPSFIIGVTVGASMQSTEIENILRICYDRPIRIPVYKAKCKQDRFELEFEKISQ